MHPDLKNLLTSLHSRYGYDFTGYAPASIGRRVNYYMSAHGIDSLSLLHEKLAGSEANFEEFIKSLSVTVTEMFRDPDFYKSVRKNLIERLATYSVIKIWSAGCATGEEAYSIAILLKESGLLEKSIIYATDINQHSLAIARQGIYPLSLLKKYTANYLKTGGKQSFSDYYTAKYDSVLFSGELREKIVFSPHNLVTDQKFNEFQMIMCRNVLIYFSSELQQKTIALFNESLCKFGFLCLGKGESLLFNEQRKYFNEIDRAERIYIKSA